MIHTFLITFECEISCGGGGGGGEGIGILIYLVSMGEGWEKLKFNNFLWNAEKMEKVTSDGWYLELESRFLCPKSNSKVKT